MSYLANHNIWPIIVSYLGQHFLQLAVLGPSKKTLFRV